LKGGPDAGFDLYADTVGKELGRGRTALVGIEKGEVVSTSFEWLHERASALVGAWRAAGVKAEERVALVLPVGVDYAVELLACFRLGLVATPIPPLGPAYVTGRLARAEVDRVVTVDRYRRFLPPSGPDPLAPAAPGGDTTLAASHVFAPEQAPLRLFSPFGDPEAPPVALRAHIVHEAILRDALLVWALDAGDRIAAPGFDPVQMQPLGLLSAWIAGAAWAELDVREASEAGRPLARAGVTVLGVHPTLREQILAAGPDGSFGVKAWFRGLNDPFDIARWDALARLLAERRIPGFSVLTNAASGGAHLFAQRSLEPQPMGVWPAPGRAWQVSQVGAGTQPAPGDAGVYTPLVASAGGGSSADAAGDEVDPSLLRVLIAKLGATWMMGGTIDVGPSGRSLPTREIAAAAERHPEVRAAAVIVLPGRFTNDANVVLLAFTDRTEDVAVVEIANTIEREMGSLHVPERIEIYPLRPRFRSGAVDVAWCRSQYLSGSLRRKARMPLFLALSKLAWVFGDDRTC
jgi:hypothetical protein